LVQSGVVSSARAYDPALKRHNSSWERTVRICRGMAEVSVSHKHVVQLTKDNNLLAMHAGERVRFVMNRRVPFGFCLLVIAGNKCIAVDKPGSSKLDGVETPIVALHSLLSA
jgi:hypothetical protein